MYFQIKLKVDLSEYVKRNVHHNTSLRIFIRHFTLFNFLWKLHWYVNLRPFIENEFYSAIANACVDCTTFEQKYRRLH